MKIANNPEETAKKGKLALVGAITVGVACVCAGGILISKLKGEKPLDSLAKKILKKDDKETSEDFQNNKADEEPALNSAIDDLDRYSDDKLLRDYEEDIAVEQCEDADSEAGEEDFCEPDGEEPIDEIAEVPEVQFEEIEIHPIQVLEEIYVEEPVERAFAPSEEETYEDRLNKEVEAEIAAMIMAVEALDNDDEQEPATENAEVVCEEAEEQCQEVISDVAEVLEETVEDALDSSGKAVQEAIIESVEEVACDPVEETAKLIETVGEEIIEYTDEVQTILAEIAKDIVVDEAAPAKALNTKAVEFLADIPDETEEEPEEYSGLALSDLKIYVKTDYAHIKSDKITLGNDESVTVTVEAPLGTSKDDISVIYDEKVINVFVDEPLEAEGKSFVNVRISGVSPCESLVKITTPHEESKGSAGAAFKLVILKLDETNGKMVYWTPTGKRYHYDIECGGKNSTKTTVFDSVSVGLEPCKLCVLEAEE